MSASDDMRVFVQEASELIGVLEQGLLGMESNPDAEIINALFRAAHTVKGNSGIIGASHCARFTHLMENVLGRVRAGDLAVDQIVIDTLLASVDVLRGIVQAIANGVDDPPANASAALLEVLAELSAEGEPPPPPRAATAGPAAAKKEELSTFKITIELPDGEPAVTARLLVEEIVVLGTLLSIEPPLETVDARGFEFVLCAPLRAADIEGIAMFANARLTLERVEATREEAATPPQETAKAAPSTTATSKAAQRTHNGPPPVKVDPARLDVLLDLVGELALSLSSLRHVLEFTDAPERSRREGLESLERLIGDVHERVMALRTTPVRDSLERLRRPVRDAAQQLGKEVELHFEGLDVEMDRKLLDQLVDPLTHMVRNACAHGIESPQERIAAGKAPRGQLLVRSIQRGGAAVIEVTDDGAGIDPEKVRRRAVERGIIARDAVMTEKETYAMLFAPGFSTAETVNQIAGRGVGLDVVVSSVEKLRGRVEIDSTLGKGTTFRITLPASLAIVEGVRVRVANETFCVPLREVDEVLPPETQVYTLEGNAEFVDVRGTLIPLVRLGTTLGFGEGRGSRVMVLRSDNTCLGVAVDDVLGMARTVVKSIDATIEVCRRTESGWQRPPALGGATILDDGTVGYLLDVQGLAKAALQ